MFRNTTAVLEFYPVYIRVVSIIAYLNIFGDTVSIIKFRIPLSRGVCSIDLPVANPLSVDEIDQKLQAENPAQYT